MRLLDSLSLSTRMFKTRPLRTFLTILGVSVGIGTVLFLVSLGYGVQKIILERIASADSLLSLDVLPGPSDALQLKESTIASIARTPNVTQISREKKFRAQLVQGEITANTELSAIDFEQFKLRGIRASEGSLFEPGDHYGLVLSSAAVRLFNTTPDDIIGKSINLMLLTRNGTGATLDQQSVELEHPYKIRGVVEDDNANYAFIPLSGLDMLAITTFDQVKVRVGDSASLEGVRTALIDRGFVVSALSDIVEQATKIFRVVQIVLALFGLVALTVSAIGMFNTMTITLLERINEIGIMRAIGISQRDIRKLFLVESMLMGVLGGVGGVAVGMAGGFIANVILNVLASHLGGQQVDLFYTPVWFITVIICFSSVVGILTGLYPSYKASNLNPLDALRYK